MNRYTFKAKRKDNQEWVYGYYAKISDIDYIFTGKQDVYECGIELGDLEYIDEQYEIIPETLCQCTGLQDIDGNYIFENDIVELNNNHYIVLYSENRQSFVYKQIKGSITYLSLDEIYEYAKEENDYVTLCIEVIGNKFDKEVE